MNKKSKSKSKRKTSSTRRKIKQVGCSLKQSGGDAYNVMPASKIYPLEDYSVDVQRASINSGALPRGATNEAGQQLGGRKRGSNERSGGSFLKSNERSGGRSFRKYSRKYYKKFSGGSNSSYIDMIKPYDAHALDQMYNKAAPFYV
jgi:hypothetical protein